MAMRENGLEQTLYLPSEEDQIRFLNFVLKSIQNSKNTAKVQSSLTELSKIETKKDEKDENEKKLIAAIMIVNKLLAHLEADNDEVIASLKEHNFYKILYHYPIFKGENYDKYNVIEAGLNFLIVDLAIILLFAGAIYFSAPLWLTAIATGLFVGAFAYLSGILYGVVNDLFATQANLPYFLLGHQPDQKSILKTNDKIAQAIAWGIYATHVLSFLAGVLFTIAITITAFFVPISTFALPLVMIAMPLVAIAVEFIIRTNPRHYLIPSDDRSKIMNFYQSNLFDFMCPTDKEQSNWLSNSERNGNGYVIVPLIAVVALISLIVLSAVSIYLPP
ncbi:MAG: hypothetical protein EBY16_07695, partial [Gammaproteobacteria bacterium]|nr:hypothetical protein [Gammaproteobacteria bacterium]